MDVVSKALSRWTQPGQKNTLPGPGAHEPGKVLCLKLLSFETVHEDVNKADQADWTKQRKRRVSVATCLGMWWILIYLNGLWRQPLWGQLLQRLSFQGPCTSRYLPTVSQLCPPQWRETDRDSFPTSAGPFPTWLYKQTVLLSRGSVGSVRSQACSGELW